MVHVHHNGTIRCRCVSKVSALASEKNSFPRLNFSAAAEKLLRFLSSFHALKEITFSQTNEDVVVDYSDQR